MVKAAVSGVHCVLFALWDAHERLDRGAMRAQAEWALAHGAEGIVILGLATEVGKLTHAEKRDLIGWAAEDCGGRPLSVTIAANSVAEQRTLLQAAEDAGAALAILQPPLAGNYGAAEYIDFFARTGENASVALAVQNAPQYLGRSLSGADMAALKSRLQQLTHVKAEMAAVDLAGFIATCDGLTVLNGRGGLEMTDALRVGCNGFIVAPDVLPGVAACWRAWTAGDKAQAEAAYAAFLPAATFGMQSLEHLACYGKRVWGQRAEVTIHDRAPSLRPTEAGLDLARQWARRAL
jgi:dihydrodipicolinate synthase/N-acetylneuraminate lyase